MRNSSRGILIQIAEFNNQGGVSNPLIDPLIRPLGLTESEKAHIVAFPESLTGDNVETLVLDTLIPLQRQLVTDIEKINSSCNIAIIFQV